MKKSIKYKEIEEIKYIFSERDIQQALMEKYNIKKLFNTKISFEMFGGDEDDPPYAELILSYIQDKD